MYDFDLVCDIVSGNSEVSLKIIDWFVTNYSKKHNIIIGKNFKVHEEYRLELKFHRKEYFDMYCRKHKGIFNADIYKEINLSIGQINFFGWCIKNGLLKYIINNQSNIIQDMNSHKKIDKILPC
ncbi:hypothetical protein [Saudi moumouvirus]|nr:hypothetical protein [Saudi moumouvirus]